MQYPHTHAHLIIFINRYEYLGLRIGSNCLAISEDFLTIARVSALHWAPVDMAANGDLRQRRANETPSKAVNGVIDESRKQAGMAPDDGKSSATWVTTGICVSGIYAAL